MGVEFVVIALIGFAALAALAIMVSARDRRGRREAEVLSDGMVLLVDRGRVRRASPAAREALGDGTGESTSEDLGEALAPRFGANAQTIVAALVELEETGRPFQLMLRDRSELLHEVFARPQGALARLTIRDAAHIDAEMRALKRRLGQIESDFELLNHQLAAVQHIFAHGSMVIWTRSLEGNVNWSHGSIRTSQGTVSAHDVALVVSARAQFAGTEAEAGAARESRATPARARVQIVPGGADAPVPLDSVEIDAGADHVVGFAVDGSQAATAERSLVRFVKTMTDTFAHLDAGLAIFDRQGKLFLFNPALTRIWRADPVWLASRPSMREIIDELRVRRRLPEQADFHGWRNRLLGLFDNADEAEFEDLWHLADGSNIRVTCRPHPDGALAFVFDDVTERVNLEQSYRNSIDLRHAILDRLDEGIAVFGPDGETQFVNRAFHRVWQFDADAVTRESHARAVVPLLAAATEEESVWRRLESFITGEESRGSWGARLTLADGRALSARFAPLPDGSTMAVFADVTDSERIALALRERNEALEAAEAMRTELLDEIAHRLRTPLNSVAGFGELLLDERTGTLTDTQRDYAGNIVQAAQQLGEAVSGVSDMVELPEAAANLGPGPPHLEDLIERTRRLLERRAAEHDVRLRVGLEAPVGEAPGQDGQMAQILFNLTHDAINRCPPGGAVVLGASRTGEALQVWTSETLADGGSGLPGIELLRRQVSLENGLVEIDRRPGDGVLRVTCHFAPCGDSASPPAPDDPAPGRPRRARRRAKAVPKADTGPAPR